VTTSSSSIEISQAGLPSHGTGILWNILWLNRRKPVIVCDLNVAHQPIDIMPKRIITFLRVIRRLKSMDSPGYWKAVCRYLSAFIRKVKYTYWNYVTMPRLIRGGELFLVADSLAAKVKDAMVYDQYLEPIIALWIEHRAMNSVDSLAL
jgi:exonuclease III